MEWTNTSLPREARRSRDPTRCATAIAAAVPSHLAPGRALVALILGLLALGGLPRGAAAETLSFTAETVASQQSGDCKAIADYDGDGRLDLAIGGATLVWYRSPAWTATAIRTADNEFTTDMEAADLDGDGDQDLIVPDGTVGVYWFENQNAGQTWVRRLIGSSLGSFTHDVAVGDIDVDGDLDVVSRPLNGALRVFRHDGAAWAAMTMTTTTGGEGLWLQDLDADGRLDIIVGGQWHRAPAGDILGGAWPIHVYDSGALNLLVKVAAADLDDDGRIDIALTPAESTGSIVWYRAPANRQTGTWVKTVLRASADRYHSLILADLNGDGRRDLITAQMHTATAPVIEVYLNSGSAVAWERQVLANASSHNLVAGDLDGDGQLDLAGCNYIGFPPVRAWINQATFASAVGPPARGLVLSAAPNPFNAQIGLTFDAPGSGAASLRVYDLAGSLVRVLRSGGPLAQPETVTWDGRGADGAAMPSGVYFAVLTASGQRLARSVVLVK